MVEKLNFNMNLKLLMSKQLSYTFTFKLFINMAENMYKPSTNVFLFINSSSGGGVGKEMIQQKLTQKTFTVKSNQNSASTVDVPVHFFNLKIQTQRKNGFEQAKMAIDQDTPIIIVICGGDGTVMWVVQEMHNYKIDSEKAPIAIIPLGTGNDFSQTFGWGKTAPSDLLDNNYQKLKKRITYWLSGTKQKLDIWMVQAEVQEYGKFQKVEEGKNTNLEKKKYSKHFCNYFSVGVDGKIGYSFDMHRTSTRLGNLAMYGVLGLVKSFTKTKSLIELTEFLKQQKKNESDQHSIKEQFNETSKQSQQRRINKLKDNRKSLPASYTTKVLLEQGSEKMKNIGLNQNLTALNINSFMGGIKDAWKNASGDQKQGQFSDPSINDGKLEILSFSGPFAMGMQKTAGGFGQKVYQGSGPFQLQFKKYPQSQKHRTYLQIDGEFLRFSHPKKLTIRRSNLTQTNQITVIRRVPLQIQKGCCGCVKQI